MMMLIAPYSCQTLVVVSLSIATELIVSVIGSHKGANSDDKFGRNFE